MKDDDLKKRKILMLGFAIPMLLFLGWRLMILAPQLGGAVVAIVLITIVIVGAYNFTRRKMAMKCAKCGGAMVDDGIKKVTKGALEVGTGKKLDSIAKHIYRCEKCGNEYHELMYYPSSTGDASDYAKDMKASETLLHILGSEIPGGQKTLNANEMTREEYRKTKRKFADEVIAHNTLNGFSGNPIKIDIEE